MGPRTVVQTKRQQAGSNRMKWEAERAVRMRPVGLEASMKSEMRILFDTKQTSMFGVTE